MHSGVCTRRHFVAAFWQQLNRIFKDADGAHMPNLCNTVSFSLKLFYSCWKIEHGEVTLKRSR